MTHIGLSPGTARQSRNLPGSDRGFAGAIPMAWPNRIQIERAALVACLGDILRHCGRGATWRLSRLASMSRAARASVSMIRSMRSKATYRTAWSSAIRNSTPLPGFLAMSCSGFCPAPGVPDRGGLDAPSAYVPAALARPLHLSTAV